MKLTICSHINEKNTDREALGALTQAIKTFHGGVVIISHNSEFTDAICNEKWLVEGGFCYTKGGAEEIKVKTSSAGVKKSKSQTNMAPDGETDLTVTGAATGNTNKLVVSEVILNPKTLEGLSKKEYRKLEKLAQVAGMSVKEYTLKINCKSPEWKWL